MIKVCFHIICHYCNGKSGINVALLAMQIKDVPIPLTECWTTAGHLVCCWWPLAFIIFIWRWQKITFPKSELLKLKRNIEHLQPNTKKHKCSSSAAPLAPWKLPSKLPSPNLCHPDSAAQVPRLLCRSGELWWLLCALWQLHLVRNLRLRQFLDLKACPSGSIKW